MLDEPTNYELPMRDSKGVVENPRGNVLCVDLDGTFVHTDLLLESLLCLLRQQPFYLFLLPFWWFRGKAYLKSEIASRVDFSAAHLPLNQKVVDYINSAKQLGSHIVLVTGTHQSLADAISGGVATGLFDEVKGTSGNTNLTNVRKRDWLVERFGSKGFDYIGNDTDDLSVWPDANKAMAVSGKQGIVTKTDLEFNTVFEVPAATLRDYLKMIRVHQWSKNALIFVPFFLGYRDFEISALITLVGAFFAMSLLASATYITNDMLDLQADRQNKTKCKRMLASGRVSLWTGFQAMFLMLCAVLVLMLYLPAGFNIALGIYTVTTLLYSFELKQRVLVDVIVLAGLYTIRVIAGTLAIAAPWSFWLLAFSMFTFFSLALAKRVAELINLEREGKNNAVGRKYSVSDISVLQSMGIATGFLSVLIVALYINGEKVAEMYSYPMLLWLVCPILMYWIGRLWLVTARGHMDEDPIVFVMRDGPSRLAVVLIVSVVVIAMGFGCDTAFWTCRP